MWIWITVTDRIGNHRWDETVLHGVDRARTNAATSGQTANQNIVNARRRQRGGKTRTKKCARILLRDHYFSGTRLKPLSETNLRRALLQRSKSSYLTHEYATVQPCIIVYYSAEDDRN